jgi:hypothetical protein
MTRHVLYALLFCVASVSFVAWRVYAVRNRETPHFEIVKDPSASHGVGCESLIGLTGQVLEADAAGPGSTVTVLVLGDQSTAGQPWRLASYSLPSVRKVLEGRSTKLRLQEQILQDVSGKCQALRRTTISPIFLGVTQAIADLRAHGCKVTSRCRLFVDTDLEENVEPAIKNALIDKDGSKRVSLPAVDNTGVGVVFCGVAVTDGRIRDRAESGARKFTTHDSDRMQDVWRSLFRDPAGVSFTPYCPNSTDIGTQSLPRARAKKGPEL